MTPQGALIRAVEILENMEIHQKEVARDADRKDEERQYAHEQSIAIETEQRKSVMAKQDEDRAIMLALNKREVEAQERISGILAEMLAYLTHPMKTIVVSEDQGETK